MTSITMYSSAVYELRVQGTLDSSRIEMMELENVTVFGSPDHGAVTVITSTFQDQAQLRGLLDRLYGLNLALISVCQLGDR